ncbi:hypothetical protein TWF788_010659 [Orbilia oligospora]|uniref:PHD-type domain-containing protein n=1 Tax=Orbilia oligospora TaxID=2813651 RepID=A0A7C8PE29_ORBOL|nr:hypothetical protein TWF788_010659 [Orbilia oligospora]
MPKKSGNSSAASGGKRGKSKSRSQTPAAAVAAAAAPPIGNGSAVLQEDDMTVFTPINGPILSLGSRDNAEGRRTLEYPASSDESGESLRRARTRPGKSVRQMLMEEREKREELKERKRREKKEKKERRREEEEKSGGPSRPPSKQSTLERHFRKVTAPEVDSLEGGSKPSVAVPGAETGQSLRFKLTFKNRAASAAANQTVVLTTNPPSDPLEAVAAPGGSSPPLAPIDANGRGRRATRNAAPCYSGFPTAAPPPPSPAPPAPPPSQPVSSLPRQTTPKLARRSTRSASPRRGGTKAEPAAGVGRRGGRPKCLDEAGRFIDIEPPKQAVSYGNPKLGAQHNEYGMMPLGALPPKERVEEVFNKPVPKEPEAWCDLHSGQQYYNFWGTAGNKDLQKLKNEQARAKRAAQKAGRLDADNDWVFPDSEGMGRVVGGGETRGKGKARRLRVTTSRGHDLADASSPDLVSGPQFSPASENVPETPRGGEDPELQTTCDTSEAPGAEVGGLKALAPKPELSTVIRQAKLAAEKEGNTEVIELLNSVEVAGSSEAVELLMRVLNGPGRLSPAIAGTKRTALQREEDEFLVSGEVASSHGGKRRMLRPFVPLMRPNRPDDEDDLIAANMNRMVDERRRHLEELDARYIPREYSCLRGEVEEPLLHPDLSDREFERDEEDNAMEWERTAPQIQRAMDFKTEKKGGHSQDEVSRRRNAKEKTQEVAGPEDEAMVDALPAPIPLMDDEESPCTVCHGTGAPLVICDGEGCREEQHYSCADPPLTQEMVDELPEWFCRTCTNKRKADGKHKNPTYKGNMGGLFQDADQVNQRSFVLPKEIRDTFTGVKTGKLGTYREATDHFVLTKSKDKELRAYDHIRRNDGLAFEQQLLGSDGNIAICYRCRESRIRKDRGRLIGCDYCPCYWHQDCLPTPLVEPPAIKMRTSDKPERGDEVVLVKWKCPLHIPEDVYPMRQPRGPVEGADRQWPPKHRLPPVTPASRDIPSGDFHATRISGKELLLPTSGVKMNLFPNVQRAEQQKELEETVFTGTDVQAIEIIRSLRDNVQRAIAAEPIVQMPAVTTAPPPQVTTAPTQVTPGPAFPTNNIAEYIWNNVPEHFRLGGVEAAILNGEIEDDAAEQIRLITAIQRSMDAKLARLQAAGKFK